MLMHAHTPPQIQWGDVPTWLGALATVAAVVGAFWVVRIEIAREGRTEALDLERRAKDRAAQAMQVAAWPVIRPTVGSGGSVPRVLIRNASTLPVYEVNATPHRDHTQLNDCPITDFLPPGEDVLVGFSNGALDYGRDGDGNDVWDPSAVRRTRIALRFRDAAGVWWSLDADGHLSEYGS